MYVPFATENERESQNEIGLVFIVSIRESDEVDETMTKLLAQKEDRTFSTYRVYPETAKKVLAVIPMNFGLMVDTWSFGIDYYLSSPANYHLDQPYGVKDVGYIRLLKTLLKVENCHSDDSDCVIHECEPVRNMGHDEVLYWYNRAIYDESTKSSQDRHEHTLEAPTLNMLTQLIEEFMAKGWVINANDPHFSCGSYKKSPLWCIDMIK